jgi:photosystem II stability/assembly factor-like uncharacterized protein
VDRIYVTTETIPDLATLDAPDQLLASTDGGRSWTEIALRPLVCAPWCDVVVTPTSPPSLYVVGSQSLRSADNGITFEELAQPPSGIERVSYDRSVPTLLYAMSDGLTGAVSRDEGRSWTAVEVPLERAPTFANPGRPCADPDAPSTLLVATPDGLFASPDLGTTFVPFSDRILPDPNTEAIAVDPRSDTRLFAISRGAVIRSEDGGDTFRRVGGGIAGIHLDEIAFDPGNPEIIYAYRMGDTIMYRSEDAGVGWQSLQLPSTVGAGSIDPFAPSTFYTGLGQFRSVDGGRSWSPLAPFVGEGAYLLLTDPNDPDVIHAPGWGGMRRSVDGGRTWIQADNGLPSPSSIGLARFTLAPAMPNRLYSIGAGGVFRSDDRGALWARVHEPLTVSDLIPDPLDPGTVYAISLSDLRKTTDGGVTWTLLNAPHLHATSRLTIAPSNRTTVYLTVGSAQGGELPEASLGLFRSTTGGAGPP